MPSSSASPTNTPKRMTPSSTPTVRSLVSVACAWAASLVAAEPVAEVCTPNVNAPCTGCESAEIARHATV